MTEKKKIYLYIAANLAFLIPVPGRFAYAIIMAVLFNLQMAAITMIFHAIHRTNLASLQNTVLSLTIISLGILFKQILIIFCPVAALTLGFCIYLPTLASVIIEFFFLDYEHGLKAHLLDNAKKAFFLSFFMLVIFLIRDTLGYGTITFPGWKRLIVFHLPVNSSIEGASIFLATIPGCLVLISAFISLYIFVSKKLRILENAPDIDSAEEGK